MSFKESIWNRRYGSCWVAYALIHFDDWTESGEKRNTGVVFPKYIRMCFCVSFFLTSRYTHRGWGCGPWPPAPRCRTKAPPPWRMCNRPALRWSTVATRGRQSSTSLYRARQCNTFYIISFESTIFQFKRNLTLFWRRKKNMLVREL